MERMHEDNHDSHALPSPVSPVAIVTGSYPPDTGGLADHSLLLARALDAMGCQVEVVVACQQRSERGVIKEEFKNSRVRCSWSVGDSRRLATHLAVRYRTVIFQYVPHLYGRAGFAPGAAAFAYFCRRSGVCVIPHLHELSIPWSLSPIHAVISLLQRLQGAALCAFSKAVVISNRRIADRLRWLPLPVLRGAAVIASGPTSPPSSLIDSERRDVRTRWGSPDERFVVVYGLATRGKRYELALEALLSVRQGGVNARLVFAGNQEAGDAAYCREIRSKAQEFGVAEFVKWTGPLKSREVSELLASADCMWNLEAGGITTRNATAASAFSVGLPVIAFGGHSLDSCFRNGENVLIVRMTPESLARATL